MRILNNVPVLQLGKAIQVNDAIFPPKIVQQAIMELYDDIGTMNCLVGIFPDKLHPVVETTVPVQHISHIITALYIVDDIVCADMVLLDTPAGKQLQKLYNKKQIQFALSGTGAVSRNGTPQLYVNKYQISTVIAYNTNKD